MKIRIPIFTTNSIGQRILRAGLFTQLRATPFTASLIEGTEMTIANGFDENNYGYYEFEITGANLIKLLKLYVSANDVADNLYTEEVTWGGTDGIRQKEYLVYSALLSQSGTNAPVPTVLENTIGTLTWAYGSVGQYSVNSSGLFPENKTPRMAQWVDIGATFQMDGVRVTDNAYYVTSYDSGVQANNAFNGFFFELRVYP